MRISDLLYYTWLGCVAEAMWAVFVWASLQKSMCLKMLTTVAFHSVRMEGDKMYW